MGRNVHNDGPLALGDPGWFGLLLDEAMLAPPAPPWKDAATPDDADLQLLEALRASGVLDGLPFGGAQGPVFGRTEPDAALAERVRLELSTTLRLVRAANALPDDIRRARLFVAALMGGFCGEYATCDTLLSEATDPDRTMDAFGERRLVGIVGARLLRRGHLMEEAPGGLAMRATLAYLDVRSLARFVREQIASGGPMAERSATFLSRLSLARAFAAEALVSLSQADGTPPTEVVQLVRRQVRAVVLIPADRRAAMRALDAPRRTSELLASTDSALRGHLLEQMVRSAMHQGLWTERMRQILDVEAAAAGLATDVVSEVIRSAQGGRTPHFDTREATQRAVVPADSPIPAAPMPDRTQAA